MKITTVTLLTALSLSASLQAATTTIPSQYHGFWEEAEMCKPMLEFGSPNIGAIISATEVSGYEQNCDVTAIAEQTLNSIEVSLTCMDSEGSSMSTIELRSFDDKYLVISRDGDKTWPLVRCE